MKGHPRSSWLALAILLCATTACFRHVAEERQLSNLAYLEFSGVAAGSQAQASGPRDYTFEVDPGSSYEVEAGRYRVTVRYEGELLVDRIVFLAAGETKDVTR